MLTFNWFWFWQKPDIDFVTSLSIEECQSRLARVLRFQRKLFGIQTENPVIGEIQGDRFYLTKTPSWFRDDFRPFLYGRLVTTNQGTHVQASFRLHAVIVLYIVFGMSPFLYLSIRDALMAQESPWSLLTLIIFWIATLASAMVFIWLGSWSNKSNREVLADYLSKTLLPGESRQIMLKERGIER